MNPIKPTSGQVINFAEAKKAKEMAEARMELKVKALKRVEENRLSDSAKYNYEFYCLVDLFMQENYPDYVWKFNVWLDRLREK